MNAYLTNPNRSDTLNREFQMTTEFEANSRWKIGCALRIFLLTVCAHFVSNTDAQEPSPTPSKPVNENGTAQAERILVTGSNIPTAAEVGPNPVQVIDRSIIDKSGQRTTEELLRSQPVANANGVPTQGNGGGIAFGQGGASISLRGLDAGATLMLIDGHRIAPQPSGTTLGADTFFDLNAIPPAAIESIEILKDGASSIYGADAIAGVVNIKLRHDYRGAELSFEYGNTTDRDSGELKASLVFGVGDDKTNITGVANYYSRNSIFSHDRDYDSQTPAARTSTNASPFNLEISRAAAEAAAGRPITEIPAGVDTFFAHAPFFSSGTAPASSYVFTEGRSATFPIFSYQSVLPDAERYGTYINIDHKIFDDRMIAYANVFLQRTEVDYELPPVPTFDFRTPGQSTIPPLAIPPHTPGLILGGPTYAEVGLPLTAYNPFNPFDQIFSGDSRGRLFDLGPREYQTGTNFFFGTAGLRGDKLFDGNWGYDATFRYSQSRSEIDIRAISTSRFQRILNAADPIFDPASPQFIGTTIPYNPFGDYRVPIPNNRLLTDYAEIHAKEVDQSSLAVFDLNIYTIELFRLPAGPVGLAFGAQFEHETLSQQPNEYIMRGDVMGIGGVYYSVKGDRDSYAGYAEASIPVFGPDFSVTGFHALDLTAAIRFEAFSNDTNVTVPKFGLRWQPMDDSLTIRATWGEGFRQPTIVELFAPPATGVQDVFDPNKQEFVSEVASTFLPNPNLQPEDSRNFTLGMVYSPKAVPNLTLNLDLFNIETTGWINPNPDPSRAIERIESGHGLPGESVTRDADGHLTQLTYVSFENSGTQKVRGADFGLAFQLPTSAGTFRWNTLVTYLDSYQFAASPGLKEQELRSSPVDFFADDAYLKWRGLSQIGWTWRGFDAGVTTHYYDGFHEFTVDGNEHWVGQTWIFDLQASYKFSFSADQASDFAKDVKSFQAGSAARPLWKSTLQNMTFTLGCNNVFNHDPPQANDNFPRFIYDITGRFIYFSVAKKF